MAYDTQPHVWSYQTWNLWKLSIRENLPSSWALDISVRMVYYHQLSVIFMRVWRCFIRIARSYLRYCILALSILFCYGICDSIIYIISVITYIFSDGKIHCFMCVDTYSLNWIHCPLWTLIDSFVWIGIVHGILFDICRWYHHIWCILYTSKVIKGNAMHLLPGSVGVAWSASLRCSSFNLSLGSLTWLTYTYGMRYQDDLGPGEFLLIQCACQYFGLGTSTHVCL